MAKIELFSHWKSFSLGLAMPRTLHTLLVAAQEGDPQRVIFKFKICSIVVDIVMCIEAQDDTQIHFSSFSLIVAFLFIADVDESPFGLGYFH